MLPEGAHRIVLIKYLRTVSLSKSLKIIKIDDANKIVLKLCFSIEHWF